MSSSSSPTSDLHEATISPRKRRKHIPKAQSIYTLPTSPRSRNTRLSAIKRDSDSSDGIASEDDEEIIEGDDGEEEGEAESKFTARTKKGWKSRRRNEQTKWEDLVTSAVTCTLSHPLQARVSS
jgi:hypothetical protein